MSLSLLEWRRAVATLYAQVRTADDPPAGWDLWREGRDRLFADHPDSPVDRGAFRGLRFRPYDPAFRFVVPVLDADPGRFEVTSATDGVVPFSRVGAADLPGLGRLDVWWLESYGGGLFLPVKDATSGTTSYGGGRYLLDTAKGADLGGDAGGLVVDLNFAYNPSCAYDPRWVCPLPPPGNVLGVEVTVGEEVPR